MRPHACYLLILPPMEPGKVIWIDANFSTLNNLFNELKKYAPQYDDKYLHVGQFSFTTEILPEYDGAVILNSPSAHRIFKVVPENVFAIMMEPGDVLEHPWMYKKLDQYHRVYSPVGSAPNVIRSHGFLGWYLSMNYSELSELRMPLKNKLVSCVASNLTNLAGHRKRKALVEHLQRDMPQIDFFGKGFNYIELKENALLPYKYSIAIENTSVEDYFTEKISDCFLSYTIPIYYGCKNIGKYFPEKSFFQIKIDDHNIATRQIQDIIENHDWSLSADAIIEARELVLKKYSPICGIAGELARMEPINLAKTEIELQPVVKSIADRMKLKIRRLISRSN